MPMNVDRANTLILDCGRLTGHQQTELELPGDSVPFFEPAANQGHPYFLPIRTSAGRMVWLRLIYRSDNGMWRIEFGGSIPEVNAGIIPAGQNRSDQAAVFKKIPGPDGQQGFSLEFVQVGGPQHKQHLASSTSNGHAFKTTAGVGGRDCGWY